MIRFAGGPHRKTGAMPAPLPSWWALLTCLSLLACNRSSTVELPVAGPDDIRSAVFHGLVHDGRAPISGAIVRVQATDIFTKTDPSGYFKLIAEGHAGPAILTAWAPGYYIGGGQERQPGDPEIRIVLERHGDEDHREYSWVSAFADADEEQNCQNCHALPEDPDSQLPFDQWRRDAHASSAGNVRFLTMYLGTDVHGNQSLPTRYRNDRDYGRVPIRPASNRDFYGPGYRLDFPATAGNCAACHAPMAAIDDPYGIDPSRIIGVGAEGIGCDFCHKIWDVILDPATSRPYANRPGVLSYAFRRPAHGQQFFAGPLDDAAPGEDVYSPVQRESRYCAPCHCSEFWGIEVYNSYGEWLESPYARGTAVTCQDCHMSTGLTDHFVRIEAGGNRRDPQTIFGHEMPGASDERLLRGAVAMTAAAELRNGTVDVRVHIVNDGAGHQVPTGSPLRQMILVVRATDERGVPLEQISGPFLPDWCGTGDPDHGHLAGLPGRAYAKILEELWTGISPTGAYWNQTRVVSDNRIPAFATDTTSFEFEAPASGEATVDVRLLYRRAFIELKERKGWDGADIEMARQTLVVAESH